METLEIKQQLAQGILDYLAQRPYREVAALIAELVKLQPTPEKAPPQPDTAEQT